MNRMLSVIFVLFPACSLFAADREQLHKETVYPVVRVSTAMSGGSGTVIYSEDRSKKGEFETFIITNHHVVEAAITIVKQWSALYGMEIQVEKRKTVRVEVFRYENLSKMVGRESFDADIVAHDKTHDIALLKLRAKRKAGHIARLISRDVARNIYLFDKVIITGCSLSHPPLVSLGAITSLNDEIDNKEYWMSNAQITFGNSGGAVFKEDGDHWSFVGIPSRVSAIFSGPISHMGYFIPMPRIYNWLEEEHLDFIFDKNKTPKECFDEREELATKAKAFRHRESARQQKSIP